MLNACNADLNSQIEALEHIIMSSPIICTAVKRARQSGIDQYYLAAGCIAQTVWNYLSGLPLEYGIKDIDFIYFDPTNLGSESENEVVSQVKDLYSDLAIEIDVKNEARVHLWYKNHFGYAIEPYSSLEAAVNTFPTTATAIGIRLEKNNKFRVYAPFGLNDLFGRIVRANKVQITKEIYDNKVSSWRAKWPELRIIPWEKQTS
ncbi:MAG TPA: nucleotidyltransferase family protein [Caproiciproducens sp.]|nr:nucleotidyltransferase family protein [Caproiciproducens sp.]